MDLSSSHSTNNDRMWAKYTLGQSPLASQIVHLGLAKRVILLVSESDEASGTLA